VNGMCDYCDCRSQPEIQALSDDHERILHVVAALRTGVDCEPPGHLDDRLDDLVRLLAPHTAREEIGIFQRLQAAHIADGYVARFEHDHRVIDALIDAARTDHRVIGRLLDEIVHHITDEEADMYPAARQVLAPADWDAVDLAVAELVT